MAFWGSILGVSCWEDQSNGVEVEDAAFTMVASFSLLAHRLSSNARSASVGDLHPDVPSWMGNGIITGYMELDRSDPNYRGNRTLDLDLRVEVVARRTSHTDSRSEERR